METTKHSGRSLDEELLRADVRHNFSHGYNCAETIVAAFIEHLGEEPGIMRVATPFGAGIGGRRDLCGILTGGAIVIGLLYGRTDADDIEKKGIAYELAAEYYRWFKSEKKQLRCSEIVPGKFSGHTDTCVKLMDEAQARLISVIKAGGEIS